MVKPFRHLINVYTQAEAAKVLGVRRQRVWQLVRTGQLRSVATAGGSLLVVAEDVHRRLAERRGQPR